MRKMMAVFGIMAVTMAAAATLLAQTVPSSSRTPAQDETPVTRRLFDQQPSTEGRRLPPAPESILYDFIDSSMDGHLPAGNLVTDAAGNFYGTTERGGTTAGGTVYELSRQSGGSWVYTELHAFHSSKEDGRNPTNGVVFDKAGNLYGTTGNGGLYGYGTVFELSPQASGEWAEKTIHNFKGEGAEGGNVPTGPLVFDAAGNIYGTTLLGGTGQCDNVSGCGVVYELSPTKAGGWSQTVLYNFEFARHGAWPSAGMIFDAAGNLYGTTLTGGSGLCFDLDIPGCGTVFELKPRSDGKWTETILYSFQNNGIDGDYPVGGLIFDSAGNLYGTASSGGITTCSRVYIFGCGAVFEVSPKSGGEWSEKVLYDFQNNSTDGEDPGFGLVFDSAGRLYGTTTYGGSHKIGTVFQLSQESGGNWSERIIRNFNFSVDDGRSPVVSCSSIQVEISMARHRWVGLQMAASSLKSSRSPEAGFYRSQYLEAKQCEK